MAKAMESMIRVERVKSEDVVRFSTKTKPHKVESVTTDGDSVTIKLVSGDARTYQRGESVIFTMPQEDL